MVKIEWIFQNVARFNAVIYQSKFLLFFMIVSLMALAMPIDATRENTREVFEEIKWASTHTDEIKHVDQNDFIDNRFDLIPPTVIHEIEPGDTVSYLFNRLGLPFSDLLMVLDADATELKIATLKTGDTLRFWIDRRLRRLNKLELTLNELSKVQYIREDNDSFRFQHTQAEAYDHRSVILGVINKSFSDSAKRVGLTPDEILTINHLFKDKINFAKDFRNGDKFEVIRTEKYIKDRPTGIRELVAVRFERQGQTLSAYQHEDGHFYDGDGISLHRTFKRYPTPEKTRITSHFNLNRKHPVTGERSPHIGTDFAAKPGSPVVSTSDGIVSMVKNHPIAGKYIVINHGNQHQTRYMHNSDILVKKGEKVAKGQLIALSGKSGRVTGPHIHYELLIRGKAVDPMKVYIPVKTSVPLKDKYKFNRRVFEFKFLMQVAREQTDRIG